MSIIKWDPFEEISQIQEKINEMFKDAYRRGSEKSAKLSQRTWTPPADIYSADDGIHIIFDLPGTSKDNIELEVEDDRVVLKGERKPADEKIEYLRQERVYGPFYRAFSLEEAIDKEKIKANYKNGILEVVLPISEKAKPKQIKIDIKE